MNKAGKIMLRSKSLMTRGSIEVRGSADVSMVDGEQATLASSTTNLPNSQSCTHPTNIRDRRSILACH